MLYRRRKQTLKFQRSYGGTIDTLSKNLRRIIEYRNQHYSQNDSKDSDKSIGIDSNVTDQSYAPDSIVKFYRQSQKSLPDNDIQKVIERYSEGTSTYELAAEFGCHRSTISRALKKSGTPVYHEASKRQSLSECVLKMYVDYNRPVDIGKSLGINATTVRKILHENNICIRHSLEYRKR